MKKISLALATIGLTASLGAFAAVPTDAQPFHIVVPALKSGMEFTAEGLLFAPSVGDVQYGTLVSSNGVGRGGYGVESLGIKTTSTTGASKTLTQNPSLDMFGFRAAVGYIFPESGNDVQLAWTHLFTDNTSASTLVAGPGQPIITEAGNTINTITSTDNNPDYRNTEASTANSTSSTSYDAIDLDVGQYFDIGTRLRTRLFGGLRAAQVTNNVSDTYTDTAAITPVNGGPGNDFSFYYTEFDQLNSKFNGIGPRFGIDSDYHISKCFGIAGHFAGALLVGEIDANTTNNAYGTQIDNNRVVGKISTLSFNSAPTDDPVRVVPTFDAKLGLDYSYIFANSSVLSVEGGYQVTQYINALEKVHTTFAFVNAVQTTLGVVSSTTTTSNVGFDGPYLSFNYKV